MPLEYRDYNAFASALAERFALRAKGLDPASARIVRKRPSDVVLAGFLTPARLSEKAHSDCDPDVESAEDLPQDSSYEQTAIGAAWMAPVSALVDGETASFRVSLALFLRRLPTFVEQTEKPSFASPPRTAGAQQGSSALPVAEHFTGLVPVWSRESFSPLETNLDLGRLLREGVLIEDLSDLLAARLTRVPTERLFAGQKAITIPESALASEATFEAALDRLARAGLPHHWNPQLDVRLVPVPAQPGHVRIAARVINRSKPVTSAALDYVDPNLYGVQLRITVPPATYERSEFRELPASFRYDRYMPGIGINAHVEAEHSDNGVTLTVDSVARAEASRLEPRQVEGASPLFADLAKDPDEILSRILEDMERFDREDWTLKLAMLTEFERREGEDARERFRDETERFLRGVNLVKNPGYPLVREAFLLMNETMKRLGTEAARRGERSIDRWRLFQLVFIVSQLPALAAREYDELAREDDACVEILWFAAGGGKTEGFLGLILWQAFFDRLRGKRIGVTAYVRFPLRLLTFQQLRRLAAALAAAELLRSELMRSGNTELRGARFSVGYFVGGTLTPNRIDDDLDTRFRRRGVDDRLQKVFQCPFCGGSVRLGYQPELRLVEHLCENANCPGGPERLPVYVVDYDIYRYLPTVIVSTVDKLALLGQNQRFANLFGRISLVCHRHGASFADGNKEICSAAASLRRGERLESCGGDRVIYGPFKDVEPALLVQDELHLLSEELGAFDAHYETATMQLASSLGARPWKIIAATATIEQFASHAAHLYMKRARQFPGPGPDAYRSFYYQQAEGRIGRIFVGVLGVGRKHTPSVTRTLSLLYLELEEARRLAASDPAAAAARYGTGPLTSDLFRELIFHYELPLTYVLTRKGSDQIAEAIETRVKRDIADVAPEHGELLVRMFNGSVDVADMIAAMETIERADSHSDPAERIRGLVTTNIIGHGVDVDRFNVIVFAGFTRLVAEYIQASARVGRTFPGISIFVATPQSERDRSMFDRFAKFHEYLDRLVDPSAVNRWPEPVLERTVPGILAGYLMGVAAHQLDRSLSTVEAVQDAYGMRDADSLTEDAVIEWMEAAYCAQRAPSPRYVERLRILTKNRYSSIINSARTRSGPPKSLNMHLEAMQSLRDVDDPAYIRVEDEREQRILKGLIHG